MLKCLIIAEIKTMCRCHLKKKGKKKATSISPTVKTQILLPLLLCYGVKHFKLHTPNTSVQKKKKKTPSKQDKWPVGKMTFCFQGHGRDLLPLRYRTFINE